MSEVTTLGNEAAVIASKQEAFTAAQEAARAARAAFIAALPVATEAQMAACVVAARDVQIALETSTVASGLNQKFRLTEEQKDQVNAARAQHVKEINTPEMRAEVTENVGKCAKLSSYKLRVRKSDGKVMLSVSGVM